MSDESAATMVSHKRQINEVATNTDANDAAAAAADDDDDDDDDDDEAVVKRLYRDEDHQKRITEVTAARTETFLPNRTTKFLWFHLDMLRSLYSGKHANSMDQNEAIPSFDDGTVQDDVWEGIESYLQQRQTLQTMTSQAVYRRGIHDEALRVLQQQESNHAAAIAAGWGDAISPRFRTSQPHSPPTDYHRFSNSRCRALEGIENIYGSICRILHRKLALVALPLTSGKRLESFFDGLYQWKESL